MARGNWLRPHALIFAMGLVWLISVFVFVVWGAVAQKSLQNAPQSGASGCNPQPVPAGKALATVQLRTGSSPNVVFARGLGTQERRFEYTVIDKDEVLQKPPCVTIEKTPFVRDKGDTRLDPTDIAANARLTGDRLILTVEFSRKDLAFGKAGSYAGTITILDPRIDRVDIPMTVTLAYPVWQLPFALFLAILLPATLYVWLLKGSFSGSDKAITFGAFAAYFQGRNGLLAITAGAAASFGVYTANYLSATTWDFEALEIISLVTSMFTAFVAAATAVSAAGADNPAANNAGNNP